MSGATIKNPWGDGRDAAVRDDGCEFRRCLSVGEDKGAFSPGRGYTTYYKKPKLVCFARHNHGCPGGEREELDPEKVRCCDRPEFPEARGIPAYQTCKACGTRHGRVRLKLARTLTDLAPVKARRKALEEAAAAVCEFCRTDVYTNASRNPEGIWEHWKVGTCVAGPIHELIRQERSTR